MGPEGPKGQDGTVSFDELTEEQRESLIGPQGPEGPEGPEGKQGEQGPEGKRGEQGPEGPAGQNGNDGKSAYAYALDGGFSGSEEEFTKKLATEYPSFSDLRAAGQVNLLDNSYFRNPVNQRGMAAYDGSGYTIDRWRFWEESGKLIVADGYISFSGGALYQHIGCKIDTTKVYTAAYEDTDGNVYVLSGKFPDAPYEDSGRMNLYLNEESAPIFRVYQKPDGVATEIVWVALYEGSYTEKTLPNYRPKGYGAEFMECQRYYRDLYLRGAVGFLIDADKVAFNAEFVEMRIAAPTVEVIVGDNAVVPGQYFPVLSEGAYFDNTCCIVLKVDNKYDLPVFNPVGAFFCHITLSADL